MTLSISSCDPQEHAKMQMKTNEYTNEVFINKKANIYAIAVPYNDENENTKGYISINGFNITNCYLKYLGVIKDHYNFTFR